MFAIKKLKSKLLIFTLSCLVLCNVNAYAQKKPTVDYDQQAKVLEYLLNNITWPQTVANNQLNFCILGNTPLDAFNLIHGKTFHNKALQTHAINSLNGNNCQVLFVSESEKHSVLDILKQVEGKPVLTMSDLTDFAQQGGGVNLFVANNQPALILNTFAIRSQQLEISKDILKILTIIPEVDAEPENPSDTVDD